MVSSGMLRRVTLVRKDVSEELSDSFIRVTRIGELGIAPALTSNRSKLSQRASVLVRASLFQFTDFCHPDEGGVTS
jgi:hypothetical protein